MSFLTTRGSIVAIRHQPNAQCIPFIGVTVCWHPGGCGYCRPEIVTIAAR